MKKYSPYINDNDEAKMDEDSYGEYYEVSEVDGKIKELEEKVDDLQEMIDGYETTCNQLEGDIFDLKSELESNKLNFKSAFDQDKFDRLIAVFEKIEEDDIRKFEER